MIPDHLEATKLKMAKLSTRQEQAQLIKVIGTRMREARELCNLSQTEAAKRLGYSNPSKLSKVENATDTCSVPLWLLLRAAKVYEVSLDFLFGVSETFDLSSGLSQERAVAAWLWEAFQKQQTKDMVVLRSLHRRIQKIGETALRVFDCSDRVSDALATFRSANEGFEDMRAGAKLVRAVEMTELTVRELREGLRRFNFECKASNAESLQPGLPFDDENL